MTNDTSHTMPLQAVMDWILSQGGSWRSHNDGAYISFAFMYEGMSYTATAVDKDGLTLTLVIVYVVESNLAEIDMYRMIAEVDMVQEYGALIYQHKNKVAWRDTIHSYSDEDFDPELVAELIECGME